MVHCRSYRRAQIYELDYRYLTDFLNWWKNPPAMLRVPMFLGLPSDAKVCSVHVNYERSCLDIIIESAMFAEVFEGDAFPRIRADLIYMEVAKIVSTPSEAVDG